MVYIYLNQMVFNAFVRDQISRHIQFKIDPKFWNVNFLKKIIFVFQLFWILWIGFLSTKMNVTKEQENAWHELGNEFAQIGNEHLKKLQLIK